MPSFTPDHGNSTFWQHRNKQTFPNVALKSEKPFSPKTWKTLTVRTSLLGWTAVLNLFVRGSTVGTQGSSVGLSTLDLSAMRASDKSLFRQFNSCGLHQPSRRHQKSHCKNRISPNNHPHPKHGKLAGGRSQLSVSGLWGFGSSPRGWFKPFVTSGGCQTWICLCLDSANGQVCYQVKGPLGFHSVFSSDTVARFDLCLSNPSDSHSFAS